MSGTPETLVDIAAEIRHGERMFWSLRDCAAYADRIEAAAARERDEDRQLAAIAESDEAFARCARCNRPERAPGNAAEMREALKESTALLAVVRGDEYEENITRQISRNTDVLSAPPRNCDLYLDCNTAWNAYNAIADRERLPGFDFWLFEEAAR